MSPAPHFVIKVFNEHLYQSPGPEHLEFAMRRFKKLSRGVVAEIHRRSAYIPPGERRRLTSRRVRARIERARARRKQGEVRSVPGPAAQPGSAVVMKALPRPDAASATLAGR